MLDIEGITTKADSIALSGFANLRKLVEGKEVSEVEREGALMSLKMFQASTARGSQENGRLRQTIKMAEAVGAVGEELRPLWDELVKSTAKLKKKRA